ncbi:hypothetical protein IF1G_03123 [Cordyceps javanica]|uniref:Uncharacterized protein n=1 Tax=Cordyceps javanica TaxID=43265 RepID=A0A545VBG8_9HYPO|nr:hypothetical protein IF1G_03123 [Cordyceps javanica]
MRGQADEVHNCRFYYNKGFAEILSWTSLDEMLRPATLWREANAPSKLLPRTVLNVCYMLPPGGRIDRSRDLAASSTLKRFSLATIVKPSCQGRLPTSKPRVSVDERKQYLSRKTKQPRYHVLPVSFHQRHSSVWGNATRGQIKYIDAMHNLACLGFALGGRQKVGEAAAALRNRMSPFGALSDLELFGQSPTTERHDLTSRFLVLLASSHVGWEREPHFVVSNVYNSKVLGSSHLRNSSTVNQRVVISSRAIYSSIIFIIRMPKYSLAKVFGLAIGMSTPALSSAEISHTSRMADAQ